MLVIDKEEIKNQTAEVRDNLSYYYEFGKPIVDEYSKELDEKVSAIKNYLAQIQEYKLPFDIPSLERIAVDLSTTIYYTESRMEELGLLEDMSSLKFKDKYNEAYLGKQGKSTVADKKYTVEQLKAHANSEALSENLVNFIYSHATSTLKSKIESAYELLKVVSKILSAEIASLNQFGVTGKYQK